MGLRRGLGPERGPQHLIDLYRRCRSTTEIEIDLFSRRLLGYATGERHDAGMVVTALHMATATHGGDMLGVAFHTNRGSEYASEVLQRLPQAQRFPFPGAESNLFSTAPSPRRSTASSKSSTPEQTPQAPGCHPIRHHPHSQQPQTDPETQRLFHHG